MADFQIEVAPEPQPKKKDIVDLDLIKMNFSVETLMCLLRSVVLKRKIVILTDLIHLNSHISRLFDFVTENSFDYDVKKKWIFFKASSG